MAQVSEITFNGTLARRAGKRIFYVTHVGVFELTKAGMELILITPGVDLRRDILDFAGMRIVLPGNRKVRRVPASILDLQCKSLPRLTGLRRRAAR